MTFHKIIEFDYAILMVLVLWEPSALSCDDFLFQLLTEMSLCSYTWCIVVIFYHVWVASACPIMWLLYYTDVDFKL